MKLSHYHLFIFLTLIFNFSFTKSNAQPSPIAFVCNTGTGNTCNWIANWTFTTNNNPFEQGYPFVANVNNWTASHGSPQLNYNNPVIGPNINHASMWTSAALDANNNVITQGEGIAVGIQSLTPGATYELTFQRRFHSTGLTAIGDLDNYNIVLMTCAAFNSIRSFDPMDFNIPAIPATGTQVIHTGTDISNTTWQNVTQTFTANAAYTVLWIFPRNLTVDPTRTTTAWLHIGLPKLKVVATCTETNPVPAITTNSHYEYFCDPKPANSAIVPYTSNQSTCLFWECWNQAHFYSNIGNSNDQWYVNDILITSTGPGPSGSQIYDISNGHLSIFGMNQNLKIQLKNSTYGYQQLTSPTYIYTANKFESSDFNFQYKPNYTTTFSTPGNWLSGPNATYTWSIPGVTINDVSNLTPQVQVTFPSNITLGGITGTLTVGNSNCNGVYNVTLTYNPNLRIAVNSNEVRDINDVSIHPNPATNQTNIVSSIEKIRSVEIVSLTGFQRKKVIIQNTNTATINVSDLKPGVYACTILTDKGSYSERLVIKR